MNNNLSWRDALKQFNDKRIQEGGKYTIPKKGTPEYASVRELMGEKISDAVPLKPNQTVTGQTVPTKKTKRTDSEEKIHKAVQTLVPTKEKPLWADEPKPKKDKKPKLQVKPDENGNLVEVKEEKEQTIKKPKTKNTKKKSVGTQTEAPSSPKPEDFTVN